MRSWFWWLLLLLVVGGVVVRQTTARTARARAGFGAGTELDLAGRYAVGAGAIVPETARQQLIDDLANTARNDLDRLRVAAICAEVQGGEAALARLEELEGADVLRRLYAEGGTRPSDEELAQLEEQLGWPGKLAATYGLNEKDDRRRVVLSEARRTMFAVFGLVMGGVAAFLTGFVLFIIALVRLGRGHIQWAFAKPAPAAGDVVWLQTTTLFLAGMLAIDVVPAVCGFAIDGWYMPLVWALVLVPLYPLLRGVSWPDWKHATGWHRGNGIVREVGAGFVGYLTCLPLFALGFLITFYLARVTGEQMSHPIMNPPGEGQDRWWYVLALYTSASIWAPVAEETVFRGALYRYVRPRMAGWLGALLIGFLFAAVHPQGFAALPALAAIGAGMVLIRQWRGSLIAPMTAHALHNGILVTFLVSVF